ncbi:hypothetical protein VN97_g11641 [Penicillium thymicola]|uniref:Uncharacterized protein n=1 Tax=Penicillium thymicola TaxID=293382 RepID=A0AAI9T7T1_PENTH|nr:hypothetical protein VN97_g11641 [Penicillium thymicola]
MIVLENEDTDLTAVPRSIIWCPLFLRLSILLGLVSPINSSRDNQVVSSMALPLQFRLVFTHPPAAITSHRLISPSESKLKVRWSPYKGSCHISHGIYIFKTENSHS